MDTVSVSDNQHAEVLNHCKGQKNTTKATLRRLSKRIQAQQSTESTMNLRSKYSSRPIVIDNASKSDVRLELQHDAVSEKDESIAYLVCNSGFFQCGTCLKNFPSSDSLSSHIMIAHNSRTIFECNLCNIAYATADLLSSHLAVEHQDVLRPFQCGLCEEGFFENATLLKHLEENHEKVPSFYKCNLCLIPFKEISLLVTHAIQSHPPSNQYRCALCGQLFSQGDKLLNHLIKKHSQETSKLLSPKQNSPTVFSKADNKSRTFHDTNHLPSGNIFKQVEPKSNLKQGRTTMKKKHDNPNSSINRSKVEKGKSSSEESKVKNAEKEKRDTESDEADCQTENSDKNVEVEDFENDSRNDITVKRKQKILLKQNGKDKEKKMKPIIKDKNKLVVTFMKRDPESNAIVYDCDVCGQRLQEEHSFIEHRDNHFFDGKFCINCVHCSQVFDSFENLHSHIGRDKCRGYKCEDCGKSFALEPVFLTHKVKEHSDMKKANGLLTCKTCEKTFENRSAFLRHASSHSDDKCMECKLCRHAFTTPETLFGHLRTKHYLIPFGRQQYKFSCEICGTKFVKIEGLTKHKELVHNVLESVPLVKAEKVHQSTKLSKPSVKRAGGHWRSAEDDKKRRTCHICHRVFRRFKDVRRHVGTHTKPYLCSHCGKSFPYRYSLDTHIKAYHSADNPHKCDTCNKSFSCQRSLLVHSRIHTGEKPHQCPICLKRFRQHANLSMHIKLHSTEKPIKCKLCDYRCSHQGYLKRHMSTHSKEKKYYCPICNKGFCEKSNLNHHIKRHSKVKNHVCAVCGHRFADRYYLNNHMRVHTKEKPYVCPVCNRAFTMRPNMVAHIKKTHPSYNYQPIKRSHQSVAGSSNSSNQNINTAKDMNLNLPIESHSFISASVAAVGSVIPSSNDALPVISQPTYSLLVPSSQPLPLPHTGQASHPPVASNSIPSYQLPASEQQRMKLDSIPSYPNLPADLMPQLPPPHQQRDLQIPSLSDVANQQLEQDHAAMSDQTMMRQEIERQQNYILNITDRFVPTQFDPQREILGQNYPTAPLSSQEYTNANMYTYPTLPPETSFLHGFFPNLNQQNPQTEPKQ